MIRLSILLLLIALLIGCKKTPDPSPVPEEVLPVLSAAKPAEPLEPLFLPPLSPDIFEAAADGSVNDLRFYLARGDDVNKRDIEGATALHYAAANDTDIDAIKYLLAQGADVNAKDDKGRTPLHLAAKKNPYIIILKFLLAQGADVRAETDEGETPLDVADTEVKKTILREAAKKSEHEA